MPVRSVSKGIGPGRGRLRVFLCHARRDKAVVRELYHRLRKDGFEPWLDEENLLAGQDWQREIPIAVRASDVVIVCLSNTFNEAGYRQKEVKLALDVADEQPEGTVFLVPVKLQDCDVPDRLSRWHWVSLSEDTGYDRLLRSLRVRAGRTDTPEYVDSLPRIPEVGLRPLSTLSVSEALDLTKEILRSGGHTSPNTALSQNDLRPLMIRADPRAQKLQGDSASASLITHVVEMGIKEGWLKQFRRVPDRSGTEAIYVEPGGQSNVNAKQAPSLGTLSDKPTQFVRAAPTLVSPNREATPRLDATLPDASGRQKHPTRATIFEHHLSRSRIGSLCDTRELFFDSLEKILTERGAAVTVLFAEASRSAQAKAAETGYSSERNWSVSEKCIRRLMLWAGALIGEDGRNITDSIGSNTARVVSLIPEFRLACEAFMAEHIISQSKGISYDDDVYYLGLALYRRGRQNAISPEELKAKADNLLAYLLRCNKIEMGADRQIRIKVSSPGA